jgi:hypothetical protein
LEPNSKVATGPELDTDALQALEWISSGMPESRVLYGPDAPMLTDEQRAEFRPASYIQKFNQAPRKQK